MTKFDRGYLIHELERATGNEVHLGHAGGTVTMWSETQKGTIICLTDTEGPFWDMEIIDVPGFSIGVYPDEETYMSGAMWTHMLEVEADALQLQLALSLARLRNC